MKHGASNRFKDFLFAESNPAQPQNVNRDLRRLAANTEREKRDAERQERLAAQRLAAQRLAERAALEASIRQYQFLTVGDKVFVFPKTAILPSAFKTEMIRLGFNPSDFKLAAVKPKVSTPIQTVDFRAAIWQATRLRSNERGKIVWLNYATPNEVCKHINPVSVGVWVE